MLDLLEACKVKAEKDENENFVYDYTIDENEKVENISCSYGESVRAYAMYGDVVAFDTTYQSITFGLLLGVWFGIDNHGRAIFFGCVLLRDETYRSFAWALQSFLRFMRGRYPQTILTDIDAGLKDAIASEFPNTRHVIFLWNIISKLTCWFSFTLGSQFSDFKSEFDMVCYLESIEDFEHQWNNLIARFGLNSDKHAALLFSYRASWPICYIKNYFIARMMTSEYSKSLDILLKRILSSQTCLQLFFEQVSVAASTEFQAREAIQFMDIKTYMPIEEHARNVLTPYAFHVLQHEIMLSMQYSITDMANGSYVLGHYKKMEGECLVIWIPEDERIHCSCKDFEHSGLLCRHSVRVLVVKNYFQLPEKYFLLRWRSGNSLIPVDFENPQVRGDDCSKAFHSLAATLLTESVMSKERFNYVHRELVGILSHVKNMPVIDEVALSSTPNYISDL